MVTIQSTAEKVLRSLSDICPRQWIRKVGEWNCPSSCYDGSRLEGT